MKVVIPSGDLSAMLKIACSPSKYDPIKDPDNTGFGRLSCVDGIFLIESSSITMTAKAVAECEGENGYCCLQLPSLAEMLKVMPSGENATLRYSDSKLMMQVGRSKCSFACLDPDTISPLGTPPSDIDGIKVNPEEFTKSVAAASKSGDVNHAEGIFSNVILQSFKGELVAVATDEYTRSCPIIPVTECNNDFRAMVPIKGFQSVKDLDCEEVKISKLGESLLFLDGKGGFIQFQQSNTALEKFPDFRGVTQVNHIDEISMSTERFTTAINGAYKINTQECVMSIEDNEVIVSNIRPDEGTEYRGVVAYEGAPGYDLKIALPPILLIQYLRTLKSDFLKASFAPERNSLGSPVHMMIEDEEGSLFFIQSLSYLVDFPQI